MKKKCLSILLLAAMLLLTACGGAQSNRLTLSIMGRKSDMQKSYMTAIFQHYEQSTGNQLELIPIEDADFEAEASKRFQEGDAPDILMHFHNADLDRFHVADNFVTLNDQPWVDDLTDSARAYCQDSDGHLLGLPFWESSVSGCYYNKTILDGLGLKPAATQAEFDVLCQVLADTGYTPICWPADGCTWMFQFGLDPIFADTPEILEQINDQEISYADLPQVADMLQWISSAATQGWFGSDYLHTGWDQISPALSSGEAVMTFIWDTWFYTDFQSDGRFTRDDFALMPVFFNTVDGGTYEGGNLNMMMVNQNSPQRDDALDFLSFCASPENYNLAFDGISTVSCFKDQTTNIQSQMVTDASDSIAAHERVSVAASRIAGYSADDVSAAVNALLQGEIDVDTCVHQMDQYRLQEIKAEEE